MREKQTENYIKINRKAVVGKSRTNTIKSYSKTITPNRKSHTAAKGCKGCSRKRG